MKSVLSFVFVLFLVCDAHAQAMRRPILQSGAGSGSVSSLDASDPFAIEFSRPGASPANAPPHAADAVPVSQLRIPSKAVKEFERAEKAFRSGDVKTSAEHLQNALKIFPDFIQAHNSLGVRFMQLGEYQSALAEHQAALALDPRNPLTHQDISFAWLLLNRFKEAEAEAREALNLDSRLVPARYVLGRAIVGQGRVSSEGLEMLRATQNTFPDASLVLAQIHFGSGQIDQTVADLRHYLRAPRDQDNKQKAECWAAQLSRTALPAGCPAEMTRPSFR